jgi:hypothetical protein
VNRETSSQRWLDKPWSSPQTFYHGAQPSGKKTQDRKIINTRSTQNISFGTLLLLRRNVQLEAKGPHRCIIMRLITFFFREPISSLKYEIS